MTHDVCGPGTIGVVQARVWKGRQRSGIATGSWSFRIITSYGGLEVEPQRGYLAGLVREQDITYFYE